jgi:diguanylate cyclase (GGDEF)-like protein
VRGRRDSLVNDLTTALSDEIRIPLAAETLAAFAAAVIDLLTTGIQTGSVGTADAGLPELQQLEQGLLGPGHLFSSAYMAERTVQEDLASHETLGATSEAWPFVAQFVRRASFDVLATYNDRQASEPWLRGITDPLTTVWVRPVFEAALAKELQRAERHERPLGVILFDADQFGAVNETYGRGVGDRVLERLGVLLRLYFRQLDWVARHGDDSFVVLLPETVANDTLSLAEGARASVEQRLTFPDHRTDQHVQVTVSAGVITATGTNRSPDTLSPLDLQTVLGMLESALRRAQALGGNRLEHVELALVR